MKIYLIDDDSEEAELFAEALGRISIPTELKWYSNVMMALDDLSQVENKPDLIFLDLNIPQVSGKEFLQLLHLSNVAKDLCVIIYSTSISKKDIEETGVYNVHAYLQKPEDFASLVDKLRDLITA